MKIFPAIILAVAMLGIGYWFGARTRSEVHARQNQLSPTEARARIAAEKSETVWLNSGLSEQQREAWHRLPEGSEVLPKGFFECLADEQTGLPFVEVMGRYGFLQDLADPNALPIGWGSHPVTLGDVTFEGVGINCSACHSSEVEYRGKRMRIDGAPNLIEVERFFRDVNVSFVATIKNPEKSFDFLRKIIRIHHDPAREGELFELPPRTLGFMDSVRQKPASADHDSSAQFVNLVHRSIIATIENEGRDLVSEGEAVIKNIASQSVEEAAAFGEHVRATTQMLQKFEAILKRKAQFLSRVTWAFDNQTQAGPGRADSFDVIRDSLFPEEYRLPMNAPVSVPSLFELANYDWLHWDGNTSSMLERNVAQAIALGADFDPATYKSSIIITNIHRLNHLAAGLRAPPWPQQILGPLAQAKVERGRELFEANCGECHNQQKLVPLAEVGTDPQRLKLYGMPIGERSYARALQDFSSNTLRVAFESAGITPEQAAQFERTNAVWRTTGKYKAHELKGIWASPPYLHNGSVPTLYHLLQPPSSRPKTFPLGHRHYDPVRVGYTTEVKNPVWVFNTAHVGNSNAGHPYGTSLSDHQKWDVIEYLKSR